MVANAAPIRFICICGDGMLCCINGVNLEDLRENKEIRDIAGVKAVAVLIKKRRLEWYGHVCRKVKKEDLNVDVNLSSIYQQLRVYCKMTLSSLLRRYSSPVFSTKRLVSMSQYGSSKKPTLAIRREDNSVWERRAPLSPGDVRHLVKQNIDVILQPSNRRSYSMEEYRQAGAKIDEDLSAASLVLGVKQVPIDLLMPDKTYAFFSHTIKAQEANMSLLDAILEKNVRLIDYEKICDEKGLRTVAFGKYAGVAGMINILHGLGLRLLALGHHTPFMYVGPTHNYRTSELARQAIREAGYQISLGMLPQSIGPLTFVFAGAGNVSQGAQEVFRELPVEFVDPQHLSKVAERGATNKVYGCVVDMEDHLVRKNGGPFNFQEFQAHPERYASNFSRLIAPYASVIINGIYYAPNDPRLISIPNCKELLQPSNMPWLPSSPGCPRLPHRLLALCDISADPGGAMEFMQSCTTIDHPFILYDAESNTSKESFSGPGILICSIDNMPAQLPQESTNYFGSLLRPYVDDMLALAEMKPLEQTLCSQDAKNAVIASHGKLTPNFEYIADLRAENRAKHSKRLESSMKKVLVLGAGYVSAPCVQYLTDEGVAVTVASALQHEVDALASRFQNTTPVLMDMKKDMEPIEKMIADHDLTISLLPYAFHPQIAEMCIKHKRDMVTASYLSPQMSELHRAAMDAGVTIVNEVGVDPGIDHLLAMDCFREADQRGGKIESFVSWCGGLPAADFSANPLRYRFSWSPKGVLNNLKAGAKWLDNNEVQEIAAGGDLLYNAKNLDFLPGFNLEGFPNRDSTAYRSIYGIEDAHTILRGTLRFKGFSDAAKALVALRLTEDGEIPSLHPKGPSITWKEFICDKLGLARDVMFETAKDKLAETLGT
ncbi:AASS [Bugula neritina]|uniref:AASS n=1 Tax=Bugula neritina TaxID=10212 RepID=A0A7J7KSI5_BUGNE|nr:AASS [Bugula neritina]